jgi:NAD(P)-dependent dehydrogenase (short-subunit alcohol dehydrogenase family)
MNSKTVVVFGGTSGIGLATARLLVASGARVVVAGRDAARGARAVASLGGRARHLSADVTRAADVAAVIEETTDRFGTLDWAVNAAALADTRPALTAEVPEEEWDRIIAADLKGMWLCLKYEIAAMLRGGGGSIVNVSSINGLAGTPQASAYCAAKHGVQGLTKTAALEYAAQAIRVNVVCPGAHLTPMLEGVLETMSPGEPEKAAALYRSHIPLGRIGDPDECARAIVWLLSDAASYVTGAVLAVDGGLSATCA